MGGGLLQKVDRDTQRFAFKCSSVVIDGDERDVFKRPASDPTKNSKRGRLVLVSTSNGVETIREEELGGRADLMRTVFENGEFTHLDTLDDVRRRATATTEVIVK